MRIEYQHNLPREEAYSRLNNLLLDLQHADKISSPQTRWNQDHTQMDFSMALMGFSMSGQVYLKDGQIILEGKLPFMASFFSNTIENIIKEQLKILFESAPDRI